MERHRRSRWTSSRSLTGSIDARGRHRRPLVVSQGARYWVPLAARERAYYDPRRLSRCGGSQRRGEKLHETCHDARFRCADSCRGDRGRAHRSGGVRRQQRERRWRALEARPRAARAGKGEREGQCHPDHRRERRREPRRRQRCRGSGRFNLEQGRQPRLRARPRGDRQGPGGRRPRRHSGARPR